MSLKSRAVLKQAFQTGDTPSQQDYANLIDSAPNFVDDTPTYGFNWRGPWDDEATYVRYDAVYYDQTGSSYVCIQAHDAYHAPTDEDYWQQISNGGDHIYIAYASDALGNGFTTTFDSALDYIAVKHSSMIIDPVSVSTFNGLWKNYKGEQGIQGIQGPAGSGDVDGPASATDDNLASYDGTTGKLIKDSGKKVSDFLEKAGGTMSGPITLAENAYVAHDSAMSADGKFTGECVSGTAGVALAFGDLVYLDPTDSRWELVDANAAAAADGDARGIIGICVLAAAADGDSTNILLKGFVRADTAFPTFTINNPVYISETAGDVTGTQPTTTDVVIRVVGFGFTADTLYFCPSSDYITHI